MNFKSIIKPCFAAILLSNTLFAYAMDKQVPCPAGVLIAGEAQHLDTVQILEDHFLVYANFDSVFDDASKMWWQISSQPVAIKKDANGYNDFTRAFKKGERNIMSVVAAKNKIADEISDGMYTCAYVDNGGNNVAFAVSTTHENGINFKRAMLGAKH